MLCGDQDHVQVFKRLVHESHGIRLDKRVLRTRVDELGNEASSASIREPAISRNWRDDR